MGEQGLVSSAGSTGRPLTSPRFAAHGGRSRGRCRRRQHFLAALQWSKGGDAGHGGSQWACVASHATQLALRTSAAQSLGIDTEVLSAFQCPIFVKLLRSALPLATSSGAGVVIFCRPATGKIRFSPPIPQRLCARTEMGAEAYSQGHSGDGSIPPTRRIPERPTRF